MMNNLPKLLTTSILMIAGTGAFITAIPSPAFSGTLTYTATPIGLTDTNWTNTFVVPRYNGLQPLLGISITATGIIGGEYNLKNDSTTSFLNYGTASSSQNNTIFADITVEGPGSTILLKPSPNVQIGGGSLAPRTSLNTIYLAGTDIKTDAPSSFTPYIGIGNVTFAADASSGMNVSYSGGRANTSSTFVTAGAGLSITYTFKDAPINADPTSTPEPATLLGLASISLLGFFSRKHKKKSRDN